MKNSFLNIICLFYAFPILCSFFASCKMVPPEVFIVPSNYRGPCYVVFDQPDGHAEKWEGDARVFEIPADGILYTRARFMTGIISQTYYARDASGSMIPLARLDDKDSLPNGTIGIFQAGSAGIGFNSPKDRFYLFWVCEKGVENCNR